MHCEDELARPYARALAQAARTLGILPRVRGDMEALALQWEDSEPLRGWNVALGRLSRAARRAAVREVWGDTFSEPVLLLLETLAEHRQLPLLPSVLFLFRRFADAAEGRLDVQLVFAAEPSEATLALLTAKVKAAYGAGSRIRTTVDPALGAGLMIRAGNLQLDASLAGRLRRLRQAFDRAQ